MPQLQPQTGPLLLAAGFQHGFFGRIGGVSQGNYSSLNCSYSVGDEPDRVTRNVAQIAGHLDVPLDRLATVSQVHGRRVIDVDGSATVAELGELEADALVGTRVDCALGIRTADCVPVLVGCRATGTVAAIHAGWRGIVAGIVPEAIERLLGKGARAGALVAAIGPHIGVDAFEVSEEVASKLDAIAPNAKAVEWKLGPRPHVRLSHLVVAQLQANGLAPNQIDVLDACTYSNPRDLFSFRRDGRQSGRQLAAIRPLQQRAHAT
jgi:polyphenol oxidase